jgi:hypothetical protein
MKLTLAEPRYMKAAAKVMNEFLVDALVEIKPDKLVISGRDASRVSFVKFELLSSACIEFEADEMPGFLVNMSRFSKIMKAVAESDILILKSDDTYLHIVLKGASKTTYKLKMMEAEDVIGDPDDSFSAAVTCKCDSFKTALEKCNVLGEDSMNFLVQRGVFSMSASDDNDDCLVELSDDDVQIIQDKRAKGKYGTEYIMKLKGAMEMSEEVQIGLGIDLPIQAVFKQPDKLRFTAIIAPRVSED